MPKPLHLLLCLVLVACASRPAPPPATPDDSTSSEAAPQAAAREAETPQPELPPAPRASSADDCVPEGGTAYTLSERQCCEGLTFLLETGPPYEGQCIETQPGPSPGTCVSTCGNGSCDAPENECNCAADCAG